MRYASGMRTHNALRGHLFVPVLGLACCILPEVDSLQANVEAPASPSDASRSQVTTVPTAEADAGFRAVARPAAGIGPDAATTTVTAPNQADAATSSGKSPVDTAASVPPNLPPPAKSPDQLFADWPMPDALPGAQTRAVYSTSAEVVTDEVTKLVWQRNVPKFYDGCTGQADQEAGAPGDACSWEEAKAYCSRAALGGNGWRLPSKIELESIVDEVRSAPAIDTAAFPQTPAARFWTKTAALSVNGGYWSVDFKLGQSLELSAPGRVRCVR